MNFEDLINFRNEIADPRMRELFGRLRIQEGTRFIDNVELSFCDGRSIGVDSYFKASGFEFIAGKAQVYQFEETDLTVGEFFETHKDFLFVSDGKLTVRDEVEYMELHTIICNLSACGKLFRQLENSPVISIVTANPVYYKLRSSFD